ncbi:MAG: hypothetical protein V1819_01010 [bacterium]
MQKTLIIVLLVAVIALAGVIVYQKLTPTETTPIVVNQPVANQPVANQPETNQPKINCLKEGEMGVDSTPPLGCCSGLKFIPVDVAWNDDSIDESCKKRALNEAQAIICTACGNGVCGTGENQCNCPADCKTVTIKVAIDAKTFDLANKFFNARYIDNKNNIVVRYTESTKFYSITGGMSGMETLPSVTANDFYSNLDKFLSPNNWITGLGGFTVIGIMEKENIIKAEEVFYLVQ